MKYKVSEIGKVIGGGTPSTKRPEYYADSGIPWLTPKDLSGYDRMFISKGSRDITPEGLKNSSAKLLPANSILVSSRAPIGYVAIAQNEVTTNQGFKSIIPNKELVIPEYLYFVMKTSKKDLEQIASGSTFKEVSTKVMSNFEVDIPSLSEQRKVLDYLLPITKKIEKNGRINDNLADIKVAIFNHMFGEKLKQNLNGTIQDIAEVKTGKRPKNKYDSKKTNYPYPIIGASKIMGYTNEVLYNESIITTGRVGTHGVIQRYREQVWVSDNSFVITSKHEDYLCELFRSFINFDSLNTGSTQPLITQSDLKNIDIYVPSKEEFASFEVKTTVLTNEQFEIQKQNQILQALKLQLLSKYF